MINRNDPLSPAARAVYDAFNRVALYNEPTFETDRMALAAALRAAVKQTRKRKVLKTLGVTMAKSPVYCLESDLLSIAEELES